MKIGFRSPSQTAELIGGQVELALAAPGSPRSPIQSPSNGAVAFMARFPRREGVAAGVEESAETTGMESEHARHV